jgi:hypothetical protein
LCFLLPAVAFTAEAAGIKLTDVATAIQHVVAGILVGSSVVATKTNAVGSFSAQFFTAKLTFRRAAGESSRRRRSCAIAGGTKERAGVASQT